jgi:hypothetical protein
MPGKNWKLQTRLLVREGSPHQQTRNCLKIIEREGKDWSRVPNGCLTPGQTGRLTVGRNITLTLIYRVVAPSMNESSEIRTRPCSPHEIVSVSRDNRMLCPTVCFGLGTLRAWPWVNVYVLCPENTWYTGFCYTSFASSQFQLLWIVTLGRSGHVCLCVNENEKYVYRGMGPTSVLHTSLLFVLVAA